MMASVSKLPQATCSFLSNPTISCSPTNSSSIQKPISNPKFTPTSPFVGAQIHKSVSKSKRLAPDQRVVRAQSSKQPVEEKEKSGGEEPLFDFDTSAQGRDKGVFGKWIYDNFELMRGAGVESSKASLPMTLSIQADNAYPKPLLEMMAKQTKEYKLAQMVKYQEAGNTKVRTWLGPENAYTSWIEVFKTLKKSGMKQVDPEEAHELVSQGKAVLIDVGESQDYARVHAEGAASAPLFRLIQGNDWRSNMRRLGYALITDFAGTERNPDFVARAVEAVGGDKNKPVILYCQIGGSLETEVVVRHGSKEKRFKDPERTFGRQSRSLKAVYELQQAGFTDVRHMKRGFGQWSYLGLPVESSG